MDFPAIPSLTRYILPIVLVLPMLLAAAGLGIVFAPTHVAYRVESDAVVVQAMIGPVDLGKRFTRAAIRDPRVVELAGGRRIAGTGKPAFCQGTWRYPDLGTVWQATTCVTKGLAFEVDDERVVITPADPESMLGALATPGSNAVVAAAPGDASYGPAWWLLGLPFIGLMFLPWLAWRISRPMVYRVAGGALTVPAHFSSVTLRLQGARFQRRPLGRAFRVAGSAAPGLYLGRFRVDGRGLHVAATDRVKGFMIEGEQRVYVTPAEPEAFAAALLASGASEAS